MLGKDRTLRFLGSFGRRNYRSGRRLWWQPRAHAVTGCILIGNREQEWKCRLLPMPAGAPSGEAAFRGRGMSSRRRWAAAANVVLERFGATLIGKPELDHLRAIEKKFVPVRGE